MPLPILLVDDEESILFATREYFTALGYRADCARELERRKRFWRVPPTPWRSSTCA